MAHPAPSESRDSASDVAAAAAPSAARTAVELTALTRHDDFLLELGELLGGRASVHPADSIDAALDRLEAGRGGQVLAIDARQSSEVRADVERASERFPHAVILVFTEDGAEKAVAAAVKGTKVFAVLTLPMQPDKTSAVLDAAIADALGQNASPQAANSRPVRHAAPTLRNPPSAAAGTAAAEPPSGGRRTRVWLAIGAGVVLAAGAGVFLMPKRGRAPAPAMTHQPGALAPAAPQHRFAALPRPAVDTSIVRGRVEDLLVKASRAMFERHFTTPKGNNALVYFRSVLAVDPTNGEALDGLRRVGHVLISQFRDDITQGRYNGAALALATLQLAEPKDPHVRPFGIELSSAVVNQALSSKQLRTAPALIAQAERRGAPAAQIAAWQSQLASLQNKHQLQKIAEQITRRIEANRLTGAASAQTALARLRTLAPSAAATHNATQALIDALLRQGRQAGLAGHGQAQEQWFAVARQVGATAQAIAAVRRQIGLARASAAQGRLNDLLGRARERLAAGALLQPVNDSAAYYLNALAADHPDPSAAAAASQLRAALAHALVQRAEAAARAGQHAAAATDLAAARRWGASAATLQQAQAILAAPLPPTPAQLAEVAQQLRRTHYVAPSYPQRALLRRISGEVTVQYVVEKTGRTARLRVIAAAPAGVFNRAALDAIRQWRYAPPKFHGEPVAVPVRTMIRFVQPN